MKVFRRIFLFCLIVFAVLTINSFAETGDVIEFNGIVTTMPEVSFGISDLEDPKSPINSLSFHISDEGQDEHSEGIGDIIKKFGNSTTVVGIDVSQHNGNIDWKQVAASGVKFAMIRAGGRGWGDEGTLYTDKKFQDNIEGALSNGIFVGIYFYSTANTEEEALQEAQATKNIIEPYKNKIQFPIAYDFEEFENGHRNDGLTKEQLEKNTKVFLEYMTSKGYKACIYSSASFLKNKWDMSKFTKYGTWVANWYVSKPNYSAKYEMWQYTNAGIVPGINGYVDVNVDYKYWSGIEDVDFGDLDFEKNPSSVTTQAYVEKYGWLDSVKDGKTAGTTGESKRLEGIKITIDNIISSGGIEYRSHIQDIGWENGWKKDGELSGTTEKNKRLEAIQIRLTGEISKYYNVYYRVHIQDHGWLGWCKNGESAGSEGLSKRVEAIEIRLVLKNTQGPKTTNLKFLNIPTINYRSHVQDVGWMGYVQSGISGTTGMSRRVEAMNIYLSNNLVGGGIAYRSHLQDYGWSNDFVRDNYLTGTVGEARRMEALQIYLYGDISNVCDVYYRVHVQDYGWLGWAKNGQVAGTEGLSKRVEAIEIVLVAKNCAAPGDTSNSYIY